MAFSTYFLTCAEFTLSYIVLSILITYFNEPTWTKSRYSLVAPGFSEYIHGPFPLVRDTDFISPWAVERFPNPTIFPALYAVYAGYNVVRAALQTHEREIAAPANVPDTLNETRTLRTEVCEKCGLSFPTRGLLRRHTNRKHIRRFSCPTCGSAFSLNTDLTRHTRTVHAEDSAGRVCMNEPCMAPGKVFVRKDNFARHVRRCEKWQLRNLALEGREDVSSEK